MSRRDGVPGAMLSTLASVPLHTALAPSWDAKKRQHLRKSSHAKMTHRVRDSSPFVAPQLPRLGAHLSQQRRGDGERPALLPYHLPRQSLQARLDHVDGRRGGCGDGCSNLRSEQGRAGVAARVSSAPGTGCG